MSQTINDNSFLIFEINGEKYGTRLLTIREVVEPIETKPIPNTRDYFLGMINIRGEIVGVIDLRMLYFNKNNMLPSCVYLVVITDKGPISALVDKVLSVSRIEDSQIDKDVTLSTMISSEFILGIAKSGEDLITIIDLSSILKSVKIENNKNLIAS